MAEINNAVSYHLKMSDEDLYSAGEQMRKQLEEELSELGFKNLQGAMEVYGELLKRDIKDLITAKV